MNYSEAVEYIQNLDGHLRRRSKEEFVDEFRRMPKILDLLGNPQKSLNCVHVTGTNGKGSTCATIASILDAEGYRVGFFTSPSMFKTNDRIKINGVEIPEDDFARYVDRVSKAAEESQVGPLPNFMFVTIVAILYFFEEKVDVAVIEVGIGGIVDPTNVIDGLVSVITNVDLDHVERLGPTKREIALAKAGIVKPVSIAVIGEQDAELQKVIREASHKNDDEFVVLNPGEIEFIGQSLEVQEFSFKDYPRLKIPLLGRYQLINASLAVLAVEALMKKGFEINRESIYKGLKQVKWPLRCEIVGRKPLVIIDGAHNPHGLRNLQYFIESDLKDRKKIVIFGCSPKTSRERYEEMTDIVKNFADVMIFSKSANYGLDCGEMKDITPPDETHIYMEELPEALALAKRMTDENSAILIVGSLFMCAEAKKAVEEVFK